MKTIFSLVALIAIISITLLHSLSLHGQDLRLVLRNDPAQVPTGAGGDSWDPVVSPDGRYVLFASTANNLLLASNGAAIPQRIPPSLNVYLRDRWYGSNTLVSLNLSGVAGGSSDSFPAGLSPDGRFVVFESTASDLVVGDTNNVSDVFVRDLLSSLTILVSASTNGFAGNGASRSPSMTPDGRYVAFVSSANNLVQGDTNRIPDVFVRDLQSATTLLASVGAISTTQAGGSEAPDITADGRYVAFYSSATNLVGARPGSDIYIRDLVASTTLWASSYARTAVPSNSVACFNHAFSADGHYLAYEAAGSTALFGTVLRYSIESGATDRVGTNATVCRTAFEDIRSLDISADGRFIAYLANFNTIDGATTCVRLWDAQASTSTIVSGNLSGSGVPTGSVCDWPVLDSSGRYVAFLSSATNMVPHFTPGEFHLYLHDSQTSTTTQLDAGPSGAGSSLSPTTAPRLTPDAHVVAFESPDAELVPNDRNRDSDVFCRDLQTGVIEMISAHDPALPTITPNGPSTITQNSVSGDGRYVAFASEANNILPSDTNGFRDIFIRDLALGTTTLVSADTNGVSADSISTDPAINADGRFVAFSSSADNLVPADTNRYQDVFVRDLQAGTTSLVSVNSAGTGPGNNLSGSPILSADGRFVFFRSKATNLAPGSYTAGTENLFVRDLQVGTNYALTTAGIATASTTPDGRFVALVDTPAAGAGRCYIWDSNLGARISTNVTAMGLLLIAISPDGNRVAYWAGSGVLQLYVADLPTGTSQAIIAGPGPTAGAILNFSANNQVLAYNKSLNGTNQVYCYDFRSGVNVLLSTDGDSGQAANGASDSPAISADGRFIAFRSAALNLVPDDVNGQPDIFLHDRQTGINTLLGKDRSATGSPDNRSLTPVFSRDGSTLFFESWGSDLAAQDFNHSSDLLACTFLTAILMPASGPGQGPVVSWPWVPDRHYTVQYKDDLGEASWRTLPGTITNLGVKALLPDASPSPDQRFYRVNSF
jgi:Tol biopolymer transport system component